MRKVLTYTAFLLLVTPSALSQTSRQISDIPAENSLRPQSAAVPTNTDSAVLGAALQAFTAKKESEDKMLDEMFRKKLYSARNVTSVPVKCRKSGPEIAGSLPCDDLVPATPEEANPVSCETTAFNDKSNRKSAKGKKPGFKSTIKCLVREDIRHRTDNHYRGKPDGLLDTSDPSNPTVPVCNLSHGEVEKNWLPSNNSCGAYCNLDLDVSLTDGISLNVNPPCQREAAWGRGAYVQIFNYYKEKVFEEFDSGKVLVTNFTGPKPCAPLAADLMGLQDQNENLTGPVTRMLASKQGVDEKADPKLIEQAASKEKCKTSDEAQVTSVGACTMKQFQRTMRALWAEFLSCEIEARAIKEFYIQSHDIDTNSQQFKDYMMNACESRICIACSGSKRNKEINTCYQQNLHGLFMIKLQKYKTHEPAEMPERTL